MEAGAPSWTGPETQFPRSQGQVYGAAGLLGGRKRSERASKDSYHRDDFLPLEEAGVLTLLDGDTDIAPGVRTKVTHGHSRGHQIVLIEAGSERIAYMGDLVPTPYHVPLASIAALDNSPNDTSPENATFWEWRSIGVGCSYSATRSSHEPGTWSSQRKVPVFARRALIDGRQERQLGDVIQGPGPSPGSRFVCEDGPALSCLPGASAMPQHLDVVVRKAAPEVPAPALLPFLPQHGTRGPKTSLPEGGRLRLGQ